MKGGFVIKRILRMMSGNNEFMIQVFFWIAEKLVERTDNELDDEFIELLRDTFTEPDAAVLKGIHD